ncbi:MAG TPA: hypothetical protein PKA63_14355 [Oligoflexia bacterium]|nr:hypothetical protein [Oligoflexia bacterium]HMP49847.1 hypothetical protein [Oligoflexia bacterium]
MSGKEIFQTILVEVDEYISLVREEFSMDFAEEAISKTDCDDSRKEQMYLIVDSFKNSTNGLIANLRTNFLAFKSQEKILELTDENDIANYLLAASTHHDASIRFNATRQTLQNQYASIKKMIEGLNN